MRRRRAEVVRRLIAAGWKPPVPTDRQADRILDDIYAVSGDARHGLGSPAESASPFRVLDTTDWTVY